jgi:hypothetical protein
MCDKCQGEGITVEQLGTWGVYIKPCECRKETEENGEG